MAADRTGCGSVWLRVGLACELVRLRAESGFTAGVALLDLLLDRYGNRLRAIGFGMGVECGWTAPGSTRRRRSGRRLTRRVRPVRRDGDEVFAGSTVAFRIGWESDEPWWSTLADPRVGIGDALASAFPDMHRLDSLYIATLRVFPSPVAAIVP